MNTSHIPTIITYHKRGVLPPVYVAGTFTDPPWQPQEMNYTTREDGEHYFQKGVYANPGATIQYKFRIGNGDWWVLDDHSPTMTDIAGNVNHVLEVKPPKEVLQQHDKGRSMSYAEVASHDAQSTEEGQQPDITQHLGKEKAVGEKAPSTHPEVAAPTFEENAPQEKPRSQPPQGAEPIQPAESQKPAADSGNPLTYAKVAAKHLQPPAEASPNRSGTGTPTFVKVAAEVADSAELLHEEVPERERPSTAGQGGQHQRRPSSPMSEAAETAAEVEDSAETLHEEVPDRERPSIGSPSSEHLERSSSPMSEAAETAAEVADTAEGLDNDENAIFVLEPPPGEGKPYVVRAQEDKQKPLGDQDKDIAHKSPLFSYECAGIYGSDEEAMAVDAAEEEDEEDESYDPGYAAPVQDIDPDTVDLNDPTLERFPSARDDIMDAVRKLETGLPADKSSFAVHPRASVFNPSRRGTEDITGDHLLTAPQPSSPSMQRTSKKSPRGSIGSGPAAASLHSISEAEELSAGEEEPEEEEATFPPAVVFTNPDMKPRPKHLRIPGPHEDEGIALPDGISPRTVKPTHRRIATPEVSPPLSPASRTTEVEAPKNLAPPDAELDKDKDRSMQEVIIHPAPKDPEAGDKPAITVEDTDREHAPGDETGEPSTAAATGEDTGESSQQQAEQREEALTKTTSGPLIQATGPGGSWISAFLRMIFVDWIRGFFGRLWSGKKKAAAT